MYIVRCELSQIQNFIFQVPRLRAMVGANRLLGLLLQQYLPAILSDASGHTATIPIEPDLLNDLNKFQALEKILFNDSLENLPNDYFEKGIIHAAGGHFECLLESKDLAERFIHTVYQIGGEHAPGLKLLISPSYELDRTKKFQEVNQSISSFLKVKKYQPVQSSNALPGFPYEHQCADIAKEVAVTRWHVDGRRLGPTVKNFYEIAKDKKIPDIGGKIEEGIVRIRYADESHNISFPNEFEEFFGTEEEKRYLAIVHTDTNRLGEKFRLFKAKINQKSYINGALAAETFFARNRFCNRQAVFQALVTQKIGTVKSEGKRIFPLRILMLGGDDLLLVMRPEDVFPFLIQYAKWYEFLLGEKAGNPEVFGPSTPEPARAIQDNYATFLSDNSSSMGALTFKAGVAIVPVKFPFATSHRLAEELAASARRVSYDQKVSAIDWALITTSTIDDLPTMRLREHTVPGTAGDLMLRRPRPILESGSPGNSLESLWQLAQALEKSSSSSGTSEQKDNSGIARSKLKTLRNALHLGQFETELVSLEYLQHLKISNKSLPQGLMNILKNPWRQINGNWQTDLHELIELADLVKSTR